MPKGNHAAKKNADNAATKPILNLKVLFRINDILLFVSLGPEITNIVPVAVLCLQANSALRANRRINRLGNGGSGEIRTHEGLAPLPVFKTGAFNRSATLPSGTLSTISAVLTNIKMRKKPVYCL